MVTRELILDLIAEEKSEFAEYTKQCNHYQVQIDPLAVARKDGRIEILQRLLKESNV